MVRSKPLFILFNVVLFLIGSNTVLAQAPNISYTSPQAYTVNQTIAPLSPANSGGVVPADSYGQVTTIAGSGVAGSADGQGKAASFNEPRRVAVDNMGNIYVTDFVTSLVRKITPSGQVSTFNITGVKLDGIDGIAIDASGNLYLTDEGHNSIDKMTPGGNASIIAGNGSFGAVNGPGNTATFNYPIGVAMDATGNIYAADYQNQLIRKIDINYNVITLAGSGKTGAANGIGAAASFNFPNGVGVDGAGNVFVADGGNRLIRKINSGGVVTTYAGAGSGNTFVFGDPEQDVMDPLNNLYVTDAQNNQVIKVNALGQVTVLAGSGAKGSADGVGALASFNGPVGIAIGPDGSLYVADSFNNLVRKIVVYGYTIDKTLPAGLTFDPTTGIISGTPIAASPATNYTVTAYNAGGSSSTVVNVKVNANNVNEPLPPDITYLTPQVYATNTPITALSPKNTGGPVPANIYGQVTTIAGNRTAGSTDGPALNASFQDPEGITVDALEDLYIADSENFLIRKISSSGIVSTLAGAKGLVGTNNGLGSAARFYTPAAVAVNAAGNIFVADFDNNLIREVTPQGLVSTFAGSGAAGFADGTGTRAILNQPSGIMVSSTGTIFLNDGNNNRVRKITPGGMVTTIAGSGAIGATDGSAASASFNQLCGITLDALGNIFVVDRFNNKIREITTAGTVSTFAGSGIQGFANGTGAAASFNSPTGITVDYSGNLYVVDNGNNIIRKITPGGLVTTLAGSTSAGYADGVGSKASFYYPVGIANDNKGNLYITDTQYNLIRKIVITGYTIDKTLPPGLTFDPTTGIISGTPTAPSPATDYTVTAYNLGGSSSTVVSITVTNASAVLPAPPNITYVTPKIYYLNTPIPPLSPTNTGGAVPANTYALAITVFGNGSLGNTNGKGTATSFGGPTGLVFDNSGNLYVSESINNDIRKITPAGLVSTFAGTGKTGAVNGPGLQATFNLPGQLAADAAGNIYVADSGNGLIREINPAGIVSTFAGTGAAGAINGPALSATFNTPTGVTFDQTGNMYVADRGDNTLREIDQAGQVSTLIALNAGASPSNNSTGFYHVATDPSGKLYFGYTNQVGSVASANRVNILAGSITPGFANGNGSLASFNAVVGVAVDKLGNIYTGDEYNNRIRLINPAGNASTLAGFLPGFNDGIDITARFYQPNGVTIDPTGNYLYVADFGNNLIRRVGLTGYYIDKSLPTGLVFDPSTGIISGTPAIPSPPVNYTITAYNTGGSSTTVVNIQILDEETVVFGPLPAKTVCDADFDPGATGSGAITYMSGNDAVATIVSGKIHITGAGTSVITASDGTSQLTQTLTVTAAVTPTISISPMAPDDCQGNADTFTAAISGGGASPVYQWQVNGQKAGTNSAQFTTASLNNGDNITCMLTSNASCTTTATATSNTATFTLDPPISTSVKITSSETGPVCRGTAVTFTAIAYSPDVNPSYQWQVNGINSGTDQATFTTSNLADGDVVTCILTSTGKCLVDAETTSNSITISLNPQSQCVISIPNTFTPNGDGINDLWDITALQAYPGCTVSIFSRDGSLVYNSVNYPKAWDGTYNGKKLPVGTYYYVIDLKNGKKPLAGPVTILR